MSAEEVAQSFVEHFYSMRANNPSGLSSLYAETSTLTFEGDQFKGTQNIAAKLGTSSAQFQVKSMDVQPSINDQSICIFVTGGLQIEAGKSLHFCEFFQLVATGANQFYIHNDIFRLNYGL